MYSIPATAKTPALIIYLLDVSASMNEPFGSTTRIEAVNKSLQKIAVRMVQRSTKGTTVSPRYRIAMFAYSTQVIDLLNGIKTIDELAKIGMPQLTTMEMTDSAAAFEAAEKLLLNEIPNMDEHPAPLVCHMTDGEFNGRDPMPIAQRIMNMSVPDGNVLVENIFFKPVTGVISAKNWAGIATSEELLIQDDYTKKLLDISSPIPTSYRSVMQEFGYKLSENTKMFIPAEIPELLELGFAMSGATPVTPAPQ
jgi:uncharacterized protein YegL